MTSNGKRELSTYCFQPQLLALRDVKLSGHVAWGSGADAGRGCRQRPPPSMETRAETVRTGSPPYMGRAACKGWDLGHATPSYQHTTPEGR